MRLDTLTDRLRDVVSAGRPISGSGPIATTRDVPAGKDGRDRKAGEVGENGDGQAARQARLHEVLGGEWQSSGSARWLVIERRDGRDRRHGTSRIGDLADVLEQAGGCAPLLTGGAVAKAPFRFVDLETTGLSGGAGTYAFLVGVGGFDERGDFVTRQYVLDRIVDERCFLQSIADHLSTAGALVSFNGKSFDLPLLETRFQYHRLPWTGDQLPHVDVLHPARRFWRNDHHAGRFDEPTCSLGALERSVLGARRDDDIPGLEAPGRYFQFLRSGDARPLAGVTAHNRLDLLSLAGLTVRLLRLLDVGVSEARTMREAVALGRLYERAGLPGRAAIAYEGALRLGQPAAGVAVRNSLKVDALQALALLARRSRRYLDAAARWREVLCTPMCPPAVAREAAEALAIHHEHRERDLQSAHAFALRTLEGSLAATRREAACRRVSRLERKLGEADERTLRLEF